ncbi:YhjD/YihY/BrkB family envelope integrity protein [Mesorhizobium sp. M1403]|uniref:YhjD/YihY/BrkB family envelope integrity protein n=1 Tax=Mesorhizobium sp. M1403 TaxID=2957097 RepID=UPI0033359BCD
MLIAAGATFYLLLALFPALATFVSIYGFVADPQTIAEHISFLGGILPSGGLDLTRSQLNSLAAQNTGALALNVGSPQALHDPAQDDIGADIGNRLLERTRSSAQIECHVSRPGHPVGPKPNVPTDSFAPAGAQARGVVRRLFPDLAQSDWHLSCLARLAGV